MQFPLAPIPPVTAPEMPLQVEGTSPIQPVHTATERNLPPVLRRHYERAPQDMRLFLPEDERSGQDRRRMCRRVTHQPVTLDTRTGQDRRQQSRREGETPASIELRA